MQDQATLPQIPKREQALERSQKVSRALHDAARKARLTVRSGGGWQPGLSRGGRASRSFAMNSAIAIFVLPTLVAAIFFGLIATDQFESESQFAVRGREIGPTDMLGSIGIPSITQAQDGLVIIDYLHSRALIEKLEREIDLRAIFSRPEIDWFSRLDASEPIEDVVRYWRKRVYASIDPSGIVMVRVRAFTAENALILGRALLAASEQLVNDMSTRSRRDALAGAQEEVTKAESRLMSVREEFRLLRDKERMIDPTKSADALTKLIGELQLDKIKLQSEYQVSSRSLSPTAPQMQVLKSRLDAATGQITAIQNEMTASKSGGEAGMSGSFASFDKARLDQAWAEKFYQTVAASMEKARLDTERQQVYLESFVTPVLPQSPEYPRRVWNTTLVALCSFGAWFALNYVRSSLKS